MEIKEGATTLALKEFLNREGRAGKLTLHITQKKDWRGRWWLHFYLKSGDTVVADLPKMRQSESEELELSEVKIEFTSINGEPL